MSLFVPDVTDISLRLDACILSCTSHSSSNLANAMEKVKPLKRLIIVEQDAVSHVRIPSILGNGDTSHPRLEFLLVIDLPMRACHPESWLVRESIEDRDAAG
jgi:hypothetical protein